MTTPDAAVLCAVLGDKRIGINGVALLSPLTGIGQYTFHLVREMQQLLPQHPWLFYATGWQQALRNAPLPGVETWKRMFKHLVPKSYAVSRLLQQRNFSKGIRRNRIQLYHEPNFVAFRYQGPTVVTVHDLSWIRYPETHPAERVRIMNKLMPAVMQRADHILVDSAFVRQEVISHYGVSAERVTPVLLGVLPDLGPVDEAGCASVTAKYGLRYGRYILAVGTLEPRKNLSTVIAAYQQLPEAVRRHHPLVVAGINGWRMEAFSDNLQRMIRQGGVILTGYVAQADLPLLYAGARMLVYPSLYEGFGLPPLEAMACGVPVIVSNRASLPEVVGDAGILVDPADDLGISRHMQSLIEDDALHRRLSLAGSERAASFTWRKCALETLAIYGKVLSGA